MNVALGGKGDGGGNAQDVTVVSSGAAIETHGTHSYGVAAQSVGGGGGDGGFAVAAGIAKARQRHSRWAAPATAPASVATSCSTAARP